MLQIGLPHQRSTTVRQTSYYANASYNMSQEHTTRLSAKFGFSVKNQNEAIFAMRYLGVQEASNSFGMRFWLSIASIPQALYGLPESDPYSYATYPSIDDALEKDRNATQPPVASLEPNSSPVPTKINHMDCSAT